MKELSEKVKVNNKKQDNQDKTLHRWTMDDFPSIKSIPFDDSAVIQATSEAKRDQYEVSYL